jgi:predicted ATPase
VFARAQDALEAAAVAQLALGTEIWDAADPLRVRMGLHTGEAELRDNDYHGQAVNRAARLMAAAHGGQILVSEVTQAIVRDGLSAGFDLVDLGEHRLPDLSRRERVFQLVGPGLESRFPPLRSLEAFPGNLPLQLTSFLGREREVVDAVKALAEVGLVTLTGVGGVGKTRLAIQVATEVVDRFPDGVWFVDLAPVRDSDLVPSAIARVLNVLQVPGRSLAESIGDQLQDKIALLVLDNFEHVVRAASILPQLLGRSPGCRVLVTSREVLRVSGEREFPVSPLATEDNNEETPVLLLFRDRARAIIHDFELEGRNRQAALAICRRLDGLPLAIELAAARVRVLAPEEILARLERRVPILTGGPRDQPVRLQAVASALDWSHELLTPAEGVLFRRLAVFRGGFTVEAAEAIATGGHIESHAVLDLLDSLVSKSLVRRQPDARLTLLQTIQDYAYTKLEAADEAAQTAERHAAYYLALAEELAPGLKTHSQLDVLLRVGAELDNLRAALSLFRAGHGAEMLRIGIAVTWYWILRSLLSEGMSWLAAAPVDDAALDPDLRAAALAEGIIIPLLLGDNETGARMTNLLEDLAAVCNQADRWRGWVGFYRAHIGMDDASAARRHISQSIESMHRAGTKWELSAAYTVQGEVEQAAGAIKTAAELYMRALDLCESGDWWGLAMNHLNLGECAVQLGDTGRAAASLQAAYSAARELGNEFLVAYCAAIMAAVALIAGRPQDAAVLYGAAHGWLHQRGWSLEPLERRIADETRESALAALGDQAFARLVDAGREMSPAEAMERYVSVPSPTHAA